MTYKGEVAQPCAPRRYGNSLNTYAPCRWKASPYVFYSFLHPAHEHVVQEMLQDTLPGVLVLCSCDVLPERREYERTSTTAISAYLAPTVTRYLERMVAQLSALGLSQQMYIMQSNGGLNTPHTAMANPGSLLLSGPAAGVVAAASSECKPGFPTCSLWIWAVPALMWPSSRTAATS